MSYIDIGLQLCGQQAGNRVVCVCVYHGVVTSTELGETVAVFGEPTKKYVVLTESLGDACGKCGISMRTRGRVGRGYFRPAVRLEPQSRIRPAAARVFMIEWMDVNHTDTIGDTFKNMLVKGSTTWCLVLDPEHLTPDYAVLDFDFVGYDIRELRAFVNYVRMTGKYTYYIEQIEVLLRLLRGITAVETTDTMRSDWRGLYDAPEPLKYYYDNHTDSVPRYLLVENPDAHDESRVRAASRIAPRTMDNCEEYLRNSFKSFCEAIEKWRTVRQSCVCFIAT